MSTTTAPAPQSQVDELVDATPAGRDRYVDLLRAISIGVVVCWHWVFSVTHWRHGRLTMPNPVGDVPLLWTLTWLLQIMPLFFFVGGYANSASWSATRRNGDGAGSFARRRLDRLYRPLTAFALVWGVVDIGARLCVPSYPGVLHYGMVVFVPLWFLGMYTIVTLLTPLTHRLHEELGALALAVLGSLIALADLGRFHAGVHALGYVNSLLVFLFAHQLGYLYRDGTLVRIGRRGQAALLTTSLTAMVVVTASGVYPHSMVAVSGDPISNMFPTTACIAILAVFQAAVAMLLRPAINRRLEQRRVWKTVVAANGIAMTVFVWHMTALLIAIELMHLVGVELLTHPTAAWWMQRPLWLLLPGVILAGLVATFSSIEHGHRRG
jgi:surface polysaccharide O-acyltransferase-like enzyme